MVPRHPFEDPYPQALSLTSTCRMVKPCLQETILHLPQVMTSCASSLPNHQSNRSSSSKAPPVYISVVRSTNSSLRLAKRSSACVSNLTFLPPAVRARQKAKKPYRFPTHGPHTRMPHPLHHRRCNRPRSTCMPPRRCTLPLIPSHNIPTTIPIWCGVPPVQSAFRVRWRHHPRVMLRLTIHQRSCATGLLQWITVIVLMTCAKTMMSRGVDPRRMENGGVQGNTRDGSL